MSHDQKPPRRLLATMNATQANANAIRITILFPFLDVLSVMIPLLRVALMNKLETLVLAMAGAKDGGFVHLFTHFYTFLSLKYIIAYDIIIV